MKTLRERLIAFEWGDSPELDNENYRQGVRLRMCEADDRFIPFARQFRPDIKRRGDLIMKATAPEYIKIMDAFDSHID